MNTSAQIKTSSLIFLPWRFLCRLLIDRWAGPPPEREAVGIRQRWPGSRPEVSVITRTRPLVNSVAVTSLALLMMMFFAR